MPRYVRLEELLVGVAGLALLRNLYDGTDQAAAERLDDVRRILADDSLRAGELTSEADARTGYGAWSDSYDEPGNPVIALEEPAVGALLEAAPAGRALDAACGTGRHARRLASVGHEVTGFDVTPEMLSVARANVPGATFLDGDLRAIPADDATFDLVVCGLALAHLDDLAAGVAELARVTRPGGRLILSVLHPFQALLGWQAPFAGAGGRRGFVREHPHTHADYLAAFTTAGLQARGCTEPELGEEHVPAKRRAFRHIPEATVQAYAGLPAVLVWDIEKTG